MEDRAANRITKTSTGLSLEEAQLKALSYRIMDTVTAYLSDIRERPVWQAMPDDVRKALREQELPAEGEPFEQTLTFLQQMILPYPQGNGHPCFAGWINSAPAHAGILVQPLAAAMNPNCGIGEHAGQELERRVVQWIMELCGFPTEGSAGVFVSGGSEANFTCLQAARQWAAQADGWNVRLEGLQGMHKPFVLYQSDQGHFSVRKSVEAMGLGRNSIHIIPSTPSLQMDVKRLREQINKDRAAGLRPFCVAATAGTVETGAIDPLDELANLCAEQGLWLHVDGAYGAFGILDEQVAHLYKGIERVDSLATDQHKWLSVPIDCGCALVRNGAVLRDAFSVTQPGPGEHDPWLSEYTLQRTRRFRALEVWAIIRSAGRAGLTRAIAHNNQLARLLAERIKNEPELELIAAEPLSIVRFRYAPAHLRSQPTQLNHLNKALAHEIQQRGKAFLTSTQLQGKEVLRACLVNYLSTEADMHTIIDETISAGHTLVSRHS
ncbi:aminotransferase class V-fold PLP-dependent enzyme [Ktedonosporobacter rubrisoli]|uniref:Aminotransferase class V-fold PLP-dependent enzyme n=1 Tax=Ktedonosporobacter rubrisoli TaxID=2509675 RepID=A0A4P6JPX0_KTERU|nr:pyridoxal-dependent decarboxylase [Ktedonosporobacter rubrisoli]QBD76816.1 aminotransferase class V-fold PLP-dependent enzyme [Ktedonosporobacter rubrisoli]